MSVCAKPAASLSLSDAEGSLVSVSIQVAPRLLESLLEALAQVAFPINPEICHDTGSGTLVVFPAYENRLAEVGRTIQLFGFDPLLLRVTSMAEVIRQKP